MSLPGFPYDGDDPEGFVPRDEIVRYLERYAASFGAPVREGIEVNSLESEQREFLLKTSADEFRARHVVLTTGAYREAIQAQVETDYPPHLLVIDAEEYRNPGALPPGRMLVVGSGQTGCQIAEEVHEAGREVFSRLRANVMAAEARGWP